MKKLLFGLLLSFVSLFSAFSLAAPSFNDWIIKKLDNWLWYSKSFDDSVSSDKSLADNIYYLFFPSTTWWGWVLFDKIKTIAIWLWLLFIIWAWAMFVLNADDENELKKAKSNILYLWYAMFLIFGAAWLLWKVLWVGSDTNVTNTVLATQNNVIWAILIFFKSMAYYIAIIMMVYYWFKIMQSQEKEDKIKTAKTWVVNIIIALIAIKVIDYVYYIAQQKNFMTTGSTFVYGFAKILGWLLWVIIILSLIYSAFLLITSRWNEEDWKKAKKIIQNIFLWVFVIFLFIIIVFDLVKNFS